MSSIDTIALPKGYTAYVFGTATAGWKQEVKVKVQNTDGSDEVECTFEGTKTPLVVTGGGLGFMNQEAAVIAADNVNERQIELDFKVFKIGAINASKVKDYRKYTNSPVSWVTNYTYTVEDGGDNDFHDNTLVVSLIKDSK